MLEAIKSGRPFRRQRDYMELPWRLRSEIQNLHLSWEDALAEDWETKPEEERCEHHHFRGRDLLVKMPDCGGRGVPPRKAREFVACDCGQPGKRTTIIHDPIHSGEQECGFRDTHFRVREIIE